MSLDRTPDEVVALPVDELALEVLRDHVESEESASDNWMHFARPRFGTSPAYDALSEAWGWLYSRGLVVRNHRKDHAFSVLVTRLGKEALERGIGIVKARERLQTDLHRELEDKVRPLFLLGDYESAAFKAMRQVEIRVRTLAGADDSAIGVKLMRAAFGDKGPLRSTALDSGEQTARMELFAGAIGVVKNPTSHREVEFDDPTEAAEVVLLADLLMRILDRIESELGS